MREWLMVPIRKTNVPSDTDSDGASTLFELGAWSATSQDVWNTCSTLFDEWMTRLSSVCVGAEEMAEHLSFQICERTIALIHHRRHDLISHRDWLAIFFDVFSVDKWMGWKKFRTALSTRSEAELSDLLKEQSLRKVFRLRTTGTTEMFALQTWESWRQWQT